MGASQESSVGEDDSSKVGTSKRTGIALPQQAIAATPISSAPPAETMNSPPTTSNPSPADKGEDKSKGKAKVTTVNFSLPSDFMAGNVLDGTSLFPHLEKFLLPSFMERFEGIPIEETGSHIAGSAFMALQATLALRKETKKVKDLVASAQEREKVALDKAKAFADREGILLKQLDESLKRLEVARGARDDLSRRLAQSFSLTARQKEEIKKMEESLGALLRESEDYKSRVESLEEEIQACRDTSKTVFSFARLTARAAIMRRHLQGQNPLDVSSDELDTYLRVVGTERDLDSDDEKEERMAGEKVVEEKAMDEKVMGDAQGETSCQDMIVAPNQV